MKRMIPIYKKNDTPLERFGNGTRKILKNIERVGTLGDLEGHPVSLRPGRYSR
jgi:hypothetical protein